MRDKVLELYKTGKYTYQEIGDFVGISRQRVHQIVTGYKSFSNTSTKKIIEQIKNPTICVDCAGKAIYIHHLDKDSQNNDSSNLIPVCKKCHGRRHAYNYNSDYVEQVAGMMADKYNYSEIMQFTGLSRATVINIVKYHDLWEIWGKTASSNFPY